MINVTFSYESIIFSAADLLLLSCDTTQFLVAELIYLFNRMYRPLNHP